MKFNAKVKVLTLTMLLLVVLSFTGCSDILSDGSSGFKVHFIDVGQGDSILIQDEDTTLLIDAGDNGYEDFVVDYLKKQKIENLNHVIGTHPHADHIGGLDAVINEFTVDNFYMPKVSHTTKTFEDVIKAVKSNNLKITAPVPGTKITLDTAVITILAPNSSAYDDLNDYSIVVKVDYEDTSFLFTGDAEGISEQEMLDNEYDLSSDLLKVGHHGSSTSTTPAFLEKVNPKYAVISAGQDNRYGHPNKETMEKLEEKNIKVYRTDEDGTIIASSDGKKITFK